MKSVTRSQAALALLTIQLVLILSIMAKYRYERATCPRVWVRSAQYDPNQPLRGRYLALGLLLDACNLPRDAAHLGPGHSGAYMPGPIADYWSWEVTLHAVDGHLVPQLEDNPREPDDVKRLTLWKNQSCDRTPANFYLEYFIPDTAKPPFPLKKGEELWVEVTLPPAGPPRPIQLALSDPTGFHVLPLN